MKSPAVISVLDRLAAAPISWGVCEVPGWGVELPSERVLAEMRALGLRATELGPLGYLGNDAAAVTALLERHGLTLVGGFLPVVLHEDGALDARARAAVELYAACGGSVVVSAPVLDLAWSPPRPLSDAEWRRLLEGLARLDELAAAHGLTNVLHPHVGTLVETGDQVARVLGESDVRLCLDTGHLAIGGVDPAALDAAAYEGWLVLEQDVALPAEPEPGTGPLEDVRRSIEFVTSRKEVRHG